MGKLSGTVLILAGISLAAYTLSSRHEGTAEVTVAQAPVGAAALAGPTAEAPTARALRTSEAAPKEGQSPIQATPVADKPAMTPVPPAQASTPVAPPPATVAAPPPSPALQQTRPRSTRVVRIDEAPPRTPVGEPAAAAAGPPLDRPGLTREIQRHLKRVGCYKGAVTGTWDPAVRQAMKALTDRLNAALPIDQPDPVLLAMVQSQASGACNAPCPAGEGKAPDGRCLPTALIAHAGKLRAPAAAGERKAVAGGDRKKAPAAARSAPAEVAATPADPAEGRMSLAGPVAHRSRAAAGSPSPARARARSATSSHGYNSPVTSVRPRPSARSANARSRGRYRAAQRQSPGMPGFSAWFLPF